MKSDCWLHVRLSVHMEQLGSHWADFHEIWYLKIFRKSVEKIQLSLKSNNSKGHFAWRPIYIFLSSLAHFFLEWEMFQIKVVEKIRTHILCSVTFFWKSCRLWDNMEKYCTTGQGPQTTTWSMRTACWIPQATNTNSEYVILIAFSTATTFARTRLSVPFYVHWLPCF